MNVVIFVTERESSASSWQTLVTGSREVPAPIMRQVVTGIEMNNMLASLRTLVNERLRVGASGRQQHSSFSIYRDILFLSFVALGRDNIDQGTSSSP